MPLPVALQLLQSNGEIDIQKSPAENAIRMLESVLSLALDDKTRACIVYTVHVMKMDRIQAETPIILRLEQENLYLDEELDAAVKAWLVADYSHYQCESENKIQKKRTFKSIAQGVKFSVKLRHLAVQYQNSSNDTVEISGQEKIAKAMDNVSSWEWDAWILRINSENRPLQILGWHLFNEWDLISVLKIDKKVLRNWLAFVESEYHKVPYHNSTHAADVLHAAHYILSSCGASEFLCPLSIFAVLIAAMIHDAGHDGLNNLYHQNAVTDRALTFNDQSVQENYHCMNILLNMAKDSSINIFDALEPAQAREVRRLLIMMTLGTDMKHHFKHVQDFKATLAALGPDRDKWAADPAACDQLCANVVHAADISNTCRPFGIARAWADRVMLEFFAQGDRERAEGLPVSPLCARDSTLTSASQIGFIKVIVLPYFKVVYSQVVSATRFLRQV